MSKDTRLLDFLRRNRSAHENHLIDGLVDGRVSRREFIRHGSMLGLSLPFLGSVGMAAGFGMSPTRAIAQGAPGATIRVASQTPAAAIDPVTNVDIGAFLLLQQVGEFLTLDGPDLVLRPMLAESWKPNDKGDIWTFTLRKGVKFHSGGEMKAEDVVATFDRLTDTANASGALSVFRGVLQKGGTRKVDDYTVEFHLDAPNGNFPYLVSTDNVTAIILPATYAGNYEQSWDGTGPFRIEAYRAKVGASFVRNEEYWGEKALPARTEFTFFNDIPPQLLALRGGQIDIINVLPAFQTVALGGDPNIVVEGLPSVSHTQLHMRCDTDPFKDPRVRRAVALSIDREKLAAGLKRGRAQVGNDSPFAPAYPSTDQTVPQRPRDLAQAKELLAAAGLPNGFEMTLTTRQYQELPEHAQLVQAWLKEVGITIKLNVLDVPTFYGQSKFGESPWLDSPMGLTVYGHRGVPNLYLTAPLGSEGRWNAAHFKNADYDRMAASYIAALDLEAQKAVAGDIQKLLLEETPMVVAYFSEHVSAKVKSVSGQQPTAMGQLFLDRASKA